MRLPNHHMLFQDDRMFIFHISRQPERTLRSSNLTKRPWAVITIRNIPGYCPVRVDNFKSREDAITYFKSAVVETPRVSLGSSSPVPLPTIEQYTNWLKFENLYDPVLNASGKTSFGWQSV